LRDFFSLPKLRFFGSSLYFNTELKILIEKSATTYLPTLILFEQIFAGFIGIYEKCKRELNSFITNNPQIYK
jgi:hypothetical protein